MTPGPTVRVRGGGRVALAAALVAGVALAGCAEDAQAPPAAVGPAASSTTLLPPIREGGPALPPNDATALSEVYDDLFATFDLRLTRGALIDRTAGGYETSDSGTHLALYVEPIDGERTDEQYLDALWTLTAAVTPDVFARWSGVESYDLCQEPVPAIDDRPEPFPVTQVDITREAAAAIDWQHGTLDDLLEASRSPAGGVIVRAPDLL